MPLIRDEIRNFIRLWNIHTIRKQKNRPYGVFGMPFFLYHCPEDKGAQDYGHLPDETLLNELLAGLDDWGIYSMFSV